MASNHALAGYKVGEISQALLKRHKVKKADKEGNEELNALFNSVGSFQPEFVLFAPKVSNMISKESQDIDTKPDHQDSQRKDSKEVSGTSHANRKRNLPTSDDDDEDVMKKKPRKETKKSKESEEDPERLARTVFVGNLPVAFTRKKLRQLFTSCGEVESVRFRSAGLAKPDLSRKVAMKKKEFHPDRHNINGYVVFKEKECAVKALQRNGLDIEGFHIRVDIAGQDHQHDHLRSIFVGNLPFDVEEEPLRQAFADCGEVEAVRIIRDSKTGAGKGFGFILFKQKDAVMFALKVKKREFNGRQLRVFPSSENPNSGQAREFKKGRPVAYSFSGLTAKKGNQSRSKGKTKPGFVKLGQGRQGGKPPSSNKQGSKNYNRNKNRTVKNGFSKPGGKQGGKSNSKGKHR